MAEQTTAAQRSVVTASEGGLCDFCNQPIPVKRRHRRGQRFCKALCRTRWHEREQTMLLEEARALALRLTETIEHLARKRGRRS